MQKISQLFTKFDLKFMYFPMQGHLFLTNFTKIAKWSKTFLLYFYCTWLKQGQRQQSSHLRGRRILIHSTPWKPRFRIRIRFYGSGSGSSISKWIRIRIRIQGFTYFSQMKRRKKLFDKFLTVICKLLYTNLLCYITKNVSKGTF